ncbi:hypothetical protein FQR65_LT16538 [Abscondita terminalis]|nr:hypothetical protein FQR65_LT16538 [Abscondita terminalis]
MKEKEEIEAKICKECRDRDFIEISGREWTQDSFDKTNVETKEYLNSDNQMFYLEENEEMDSTWNKKIKTKYPELIEGYKEICKGGKYTLIEQKTTYKTEEGNEKRKENVMAIFLEEDNQNKEKNTYLTMKR